MFSKANTQAADIEAAANFADRQARLALLWGDEQAYNLWWALKVQLKYGRPEIRAALSRLSAYECRVLIEAQRSEDANVGTRWANVGNAWWAIRHGIERRGEQTGGQKARIIAFRDRCAASA